MSPYYKKFILSLGIGLAVLALFVGLVVTPLILKISSASKSYLKNETALAKLNQREKFLKELEKDYQADLENLSVFDQVFISSQEIVGFITILEQLARETGNIFEIKSATSPLSGKETKEVQEPFLAFRISLWGDFNQLLRFIVSLEDNPYPPYRLIEIENLAVKRLDERNLVNLDPSLGQGDLESAIDIKVYIQ